MLNTKDIGMVTITKGKPAAKGSSATLAYMVVAICTSTVAINIENNNVDISFSVFQSRNSGMMDIQMILLISSGVSSSVQLNPDCAYSLIYKI